MVQTAAAAAPPQRHSWPDAQQELLLRAAAGPIDQAYACFCAWNDQTDWSGDIEPASYRLLPLVYARLRRLGVEHGEMPRLRGIYRHSWCEAQNKLRAAETAISVLEAAGIAVMASKGLALIIGHYETAALRPMNDIDLYVPRRQLPEAVAALSAAGWRISDPRADRGLQDMAILHASATFWHDEWGELDLHWRLMENFLAKALIRRFWQRSRLCSLGTTQVRIPAPDDLLLHVVAHGVLGNTLSPIRWIPDAVTILDVHGAKFDWPGLLRFASDNWLAGRLVRGLRYAQALTGIAVPAMVMQYRPRLAERIDQRLLLDYIGGHRPSYQQNLLIALHVAKIARDDDRRHLPRLVRQAVVRRLGIARP